MGSERIYLAVERRYKLRCSGKAESQTPMFRESRDTNSDSLSSPKLSQLSLPLPSLHQDHQIQWQINPYLQTA
ncbi:hypothetical protein PAXRUDRAFT_22016 [Paxillus rubicundulus Ve08.2h10]|uniref:Uncharacterized protein n=1 Tax=Paxillus rubicundulus Ve08.2h10 TaxID=930991 RepID=A0A0D0CNS9_9AGAM|nr:hypothetical protein PAXRUDRAFT_22016 [Paxillus rubicundulus Ve08.2h10]